MFFMEKLSIFAERLQELLNVAEINALTLSKRIGCGHSAISRYMAGENPSLENLIKIADYFQCSTDFLLGFTEDSGCPPFMQIPPFKERLPYLLKLYGISRYGLQKKTELAPSLLYYYAKGQKSPTLDSIIRIAKALDYSIDFVLGRVK